MTKNKSLRELEQIQQNLEYQNQELRVFVADILPKDLEIRQNMEDRMIELENLVNTYGWVVIVKHIQNESDLDKIPKVKISMSQIAARGSKQN